MICPFCQSENIEGVEVCANCGRDLGGLDLPGGGLDDSAPSFLQDPLAKLSGKPVGRMASPSDPVGFAVHLMQNEGVGCVLVVEKDRVVGIITATDILHKVAGPKEDLNAVRCAEIMTPDPTLLDAEDSVALAINKMAFGEFRHVPVLKDGRATQVLDVNAVFRHLSPHLV